MTPSELKTLPPENLAQLWNTYMLSELTPEFRVCLNSPKNIEEYFLIPEEFQPSEKRQRFNPKDTWVTSDYEKRLHSANRVHKLINVKALSKWTSTHNL